MQRSVKGERFRTVARRREAGGSKPKEELDYKESSETGVIKTENGESSETKVIKTENGDLSA